MARPSIAARPRRKPRAVGGAHRIGDRTDHIEGRYRRITVHQLVLAWWLFKSGTITKRQLRVYFAAHELEERRRYAVEADQPLYTLREIARLVGGAAGDESGGGGRARARLRADIRALHRVGLVSIRKHEIRFAVSADQIKPAALAEPLEGFWAVFREMPNPRRTVPVPRRTLRALAAGFATNVTALVIALLIRGLFWHKDKKSGGGDYRIDGRYKLAWVSEHFGISRRGATDARARLIELGWLEPIPVTQWEMNKWGLHDRIVPGWTMDNSADQQATRQPDPQPDQQTDRHAGTQADHGPAQPEAGPQAVGGVPVREEGVGVTGSASPRAEIDPGSASPDQTDSLSLSGEQRTRTLRTRGAGRDRPGVSPNGTRGSGGGETRSDRWAQPSQPTNQSASARRTKRSGTRSGKQSRQPSGGGADAPPNIRDIRDTDLRDTDRLLELHRQACEAGLASRSEAGRLDFFALAERARARGKRPGAMFYWLIREKKTAFITLHDEDEAARRIREHLNGKAARTIAPHDESGGVTKPRAMPELTDDQKFVTACIRVAKQKRGLEAFTIARAKGWTRERFESIELELQRIDLERWRTSTERGDEKM